LVPSVSSVVFAVKYPALPGIYCLSEDGCEFAPKDVLHRDLRLPDELPRLRKGRGHAHLGGLRPGAARGRSRPHPLQHMLDPRQGRAEGFSPPERFQEAAQGREALCRARLRRPAGGRKDLRARTLRLAGGRLGLVSQFTRDAGAHWCRRGPGHRAR